MKTKGFTKIIINMAIRKWNNRNPGWTTGDGVNSDNSDGSCTDDDDNGVIKRTKSK